MNLLWKWGKGRLKPEELTRLDPLMRTGAGSEFKRQLPILVSNITNRLHSGFHAEDGLRKPLPPYGPGYAKAKAKLGHPSTPNMTVTGNLLQHISAIIRSPSDGQLWARVRPWGAANHLGLVGNAHSTDYAGELLKERVIPGSDMIWIAPYQYSRNGVIIDVPAYARRLTPRERVQLNREISTYTGTYFYNDALMTRLASRLGYGHWALGAMSRSVTPLLSLTTEEFAEFQRRIIKASSREAAKAIEALVR